MTSLARRLKSARLAANLGVNELSQKAGVGNGVVSRIENGKNKGTPETIATLASTLDVSLDWLWRGKGDGPPLVEEEPAAEEIDDEFAARYPNLATVLDLAIEKGVSPAIIRNARRAALKSDSDRPAAVWWAMLQDVIALEKKMDADLAAGKDISPKLDEAAAREEDPPESTETPPPAPPKPRVPKRSKK
jgi:transcriptional regulator with XRE-family HTH domain